MLSSMSSASVYIVSVKAFIRLDFVGAKHEEVNYVVLGEKNIRVEVSGLL